MENYCILVVEDQELLQIAIRDILDLEGYKVLTASDGVEALSVMEKNRPDLILADIMMPRMDGYAFYEEVRARPEWVPIPFIFLTAKAEKEDVIRGKSLGAEDYIVKPFDPQELVVAVEAKLGRARAIREVTESEFDALKQQIINLLSHELRTPLTSVCGYTELALEEAARLPSQDFQKFLVGVKRGADRLTRLVEDLLWLVRLDTGQVDREFELLSTISADMDSLVFHTVGLYNVTAEAKGVNIILDMESDLPSVRLYDPFFSEAFGRLLDNSIKFTRDRSDQIFVKVWHADDRVKVSITDEGVGISAEDMERLFARFGQINRIQMEQQGLGMGLVIAQALIRIHNGELEVVSELDKGSTFTISLPVVK